MHQHIVEEPQVDVGKVVGQDRLNLIVNRLAKGGVRLCAALIDQRVEPRVDVEAAVRPVWRKLLGVKSVFENIGIFVAANPPQRIHLVGAASDVGKESGELKGANIKLDTDRAQLLLQHGGDQARRL